MTLAEIEKTLTRSVPGTREFERAYALWLRVMDNAHGATRYAQPTTYEPRNNVPSHMQRKGQP